MLADPPPAPDPDELVQLNVRVPRWLRDRIDERREHVIDRTTGRKMSQATWIANAAKFALQQRPAPKTAPGRRTAR